MAFEIIRNDISRVCADAIVNSANPAPICGSGADYAVYQAAGREQLLEARRKIGSIAPGRAVATPAFALHANYIIHTVGPVWVDGNCGELETLTACYRNSLQLAMELRCKSIAFPLISTGVYGFPKDLALKIAMTELQQFAAKRAIDVFLVVFDADSYQLSGALFKEIESFVDANYVEQANIKEYGRPTGAAASTYAQGDSRSLESQISVTVQTFQEKLLELIDQKGVSNSSVYKPAHISRQSFSKMQCNRDYQPSKNNAVLFCLALKLDLRETIDLLGRAGYTLSPSSKTDVIITACINAGEYDLNEIELILYKHGCPELRKY